MDLRDPKKSFRFYIIYLYNLFFKGLLIISSLILLRIIYKPVGKYLSILSIECNQEDYVKESENLLTISNFEKSQIFINNLVSSQKNLQSDKNNFDFDSPIRKEEHQLDNIGVILLTGGKPKTIHATSRYQVAEIIKKHKVIAGVTGAYFSMKYLDSDEIIGPVFSSNRQAFFPGKEKHNHLLKGRPLVLITNQTVHFLPYNPKKHNSVSGVHDTLASFNNENSKKILTDLFVAGAWLVKEGRPQSSESFSSLVDFDTIRFRAFWGISYTGKPVIGVSTTRVDSVSLGQILAKLGFREAVMLDSGNSTSLAYKNKSLVKYIPRPVPHVIGLAEN